MILAEGVQVENDADWPTIAAKSGVFPNWGAKSGSHDWLYWVVESTLSLAKAFRCPLSARSPMVLAASPGMFPKIAGASELQNPQNRLGLA